MKLLCLAVLSSLVCSTVGSPQGYYGECSIDYGRSSSAASASTSSEPSSSVPSSEPSSSSMSSSSSLPPSNSSSTSTISATASATQNAIVIVSPTPCLIAPKPSGTPIDESNANFTQTNNGLTYQQYPNSRYKVQANDSSPPLYLDFSDTTQLSISDEDGNTLILYENGTYAAYYAVDTDICELAVLGVWDPDAVAGVTKRDDTALSLFDKRQAGTGTCKEIAFFCTNRVGQAFHAVAANGLCFALGQGIGQAVGGGIGFLGNVFGPQVGIPTTIIGAAIGGRIGAWFAGLYGNSLCTLAMFGATSKMCDACPDPRLCGEGTLKCALEGPCQDVLSDPNNCGACGNVCPSGRCRNGQCTQPTCNQSVCGSLAMCDSTCYCFTTAGGTGFCGPSTPCLGLADCSSDFDCEQGMICAVGTCCGRNVCHPPCTTFAKRDLSIGSNNETEMYSNGLGGVTNLLAI